MEPVRADYGNVALVDRPLPGGNYIVMPTHTLVLNEYKTKTKYGTFHRNVPQELMDIIRLSLQRHPRQYLFVDESGRPYELQNSYTKFANRLLKNIFGKSVTISLLRHSFISGIDFNRTTPAQLMEISHNMMHSMVMQQLYRRQVEPSSPHQGYQIIDHPRPTAPAQQHQNQQERVFLI
jgi:integrase